MSKNNMKKPEPAADWGWTPALVLTLAATAISAVLTGVVWVAWTKAEEATATKFELAEQRVDGLKESMAILERRSADQKAAIVAILSKDKDLPKVLRHLTRDQSLLSGVASLEAGRYSEALISMRNAPPSEDRTAILGYSQAMLRTKATDPEVPAAERDQIKYALWRFQHPDDLLEAPNKQPESESPQ
jgi:hypothetical protein